MGFMLGLRLDTAMLGSELAQVLSSLYTTLILPYLNYGILAWGNPSKTLIDRILILQKRALRIIHNVYFRSHITTYFYKTKLLKLMIRILGTSVFLCSNWLITNYRFPLFSKKITRYIHTHKTVKPLPHSSNENSFRTKTIIYTGPVFWNNIDPSLNKQSTSLYTFKQKLKIKLLNTYTWSNLGLFVARLKSLSQSLSPSFYCNFPFLEPNHSFSLFCIFLSFCLLLFSSIFSSFLYSPPPPPI